MSKDLEKLHSLIENKTLPEAKNVIGIYEKFDLINGKCTVISAVTFDTAVNINEHDLVTGMIPDHNSYSVTHTGEYKHLGNAWSTGMGYLRGNKIKQSKTVFPYEVYISDPKNTDAKDLVTQVHFPLK